MKEKTFEELIEDVSDKNNYATRLWRQQLTPNADVVKLLQQVREATNEEWCQAFLGVTLPAEAVKKIGAIITKPNSIKTN